MSGVVFCSECGSKVAVGTKFCISCGSPIPVNSVPVSTDTVGVNNIIGEIDDEATVAAFNSPMAAASIAQAPVQSVMRPEMQPMMQPEMQSMVQNPIQPETQTGAAIPEVFAQITNDDATVAAMPMSAAPVTVASMPEAPMPVAPVTVASMPEAPMSAAPVTVASMPEAPMPAAPVSAVSSPAPAAPSAPASVSSAPVQENVAASVAAVASAAIAPTMANTPSSVPPMPEVPSGKTAAQQYESAMINNGMKVDTSAMDAQKKEDARIAKENKAKENQQVAGDNANKSERKLIEQGLPIEYKPVNMWKYYGIGLLLGIPIIGFILTFVFAFAPKNRNIKNYARSYFCAWIVNAVITILVIIALIVLGSKLLSSMKDSIGIDLEPIVNPILEFFNK